MHFFGNGQDFSRGKFLPLGGSLKRFADLRRIGLLRHFQIAAPKIGADVGWRTLTAAALIAVLPSNLHAACVIKTADQLIDEAFIDLLDSGNFASSAVLTAPKKPTNNTSPSSPNVKPVGVPSPILVPRDKTVSLMIGDQTIKAVFLDTTLREFELRSLLKGKTVGAVLDITECPTKAVCDKKKDPSVSNNVPDPLPIAGPGGNPGTGPGTSPTTGPNTVPSPVPLPGTIPLLLSGIGGLVIMARRKKAANKV